MKSWCGGELCKTKLNPNNSKNPELGAESVLGWGSEALVDVLVLVGNLGGNDLTVVAGFACSELALEASPV